MYVTLREQILPQLIPANARVLVAISGGPDSMALGHILWRYAHETMADNISLVFTHVHHGVRAESDEEAQMVERMASEWKVPCIVHRFDAKKYAKEFGFSFQEGAREWRYARWKEDMANYGCNLLATAHHLGDQAETILYRLLRGSGTAGLSGIHPNKDGVIRPLLTVAKEDILEYCRQERLPYALDRSNEEPVYVRNSIRLKLLPELAHDYNPQILAALGRTGELLRWDEEYLNGAAEEAFKKYLVAAEDNDKVCLNLSVFSESPAIFSRLLRKAAAVVTNEQRGLGFSYIKKIMDSKGTSGWRQNLPGIDVVIRDEGIWFTRQGIEENNQFLQTSEDEIQLVLGKWVNVPQKGIRIGLFNALSDDNNLQEADTDRTAIFQTNKIMQLKEPIVYRSRRQGDRICIKGIGNKALKKVFQEAGISPQERNRLMLIASGSNVLWIPEIKKSNCYSPIENSNSLYIILRKADSGDGQGSL